MPRSLFSSSCSLYGAAGDGPSPRTAPSTRSRRTARARCWPSDGSPAGRRRLQPDLPAQRDGVRRLAAAAGRHRGQQPRRHRVHAREVRLQSDGSPWRPLVHAEDISRAFLAVLHAVARPCTTRPSTSAGTRTSCRCATSPSQRGGALGRARDLRRQRLVPIPATTGSTSARRRGVLPDFQPQWTVPGGIDELAEDMERHGLAAEDFEGPRFVRLHGSTSCGGRPTRRPAPDQVREPRVTLAEVVARARVDGGQARRRGEYAQRACIPAAAASPAPEPATPRDAGTTTAAEPRRDALEHPGLRLGRSGRVDTARDPTRRPHGSRVRRPRGPHPAPGRLQRPGAGSTLRAELPPHLHTLP